MANMFLLGAMIVLMVSSVVHTRNPSILCRPDQVFDSDVQKCFRLRYSISALVKEILDNSDTSVPFLHYTPDSLTSKTNISVPNSVSVSDLFIQNLAFINEANMTDCIGMAACNEHCYSWLERSPEKQQNEQAIIDKYLAVSDSSKKDDDDDLTPDFVRVIMQASKKGINLAKDGASSKNSRSMCLGCTKDYANSCPPMNYAYTVRINALYRKLIEANVTFSNLAPKLPQNLSPEMLYYHYSMHFVQRANLTTCYALVSCENTCLLYQATIAELGPNMVEPPTSEAVLMKGDPNKAEAIDTIHDAALIGYKLASNDGCAECRRHYSGCTDDKYEIAKASAAIFGN